VGVRGHRKDQRAASGNRAAIQPQAGHAALPYGPARVHQPDTAIKEGSHMDTDGNNNLAPSTDIHSRRYDEKIRSGQQAAHRAVDRMADGAGRLADSADHFARRGMHAMRERGHQVREHARHMTDTTVVHIREEPLKSVLIAAAIGAAIGYLLSMGRSRR